MSNTPTSGTSHPTSCIQRLTSRISHLATSTIIQLLTTAIKFRKAGLISLLAFFLINCYFMLFDQQAYIAFLEHYISPDGHISDINGVFFKVQVSTILMAIFWFLIDQPSIDLIKKQSLRDSNSLPWRQRSILYIVACIIWLLISYTPFLFLDSETIINSIKDDSFFQNCGAFFLFAAAVLFFHLFYKSKEKDQPGKFHKNRNIWFLLLGLLFIFGTGEEISWGQRIFHFKTPEFMSSNIQGEFTIHNLPWFDSRTEKPFLNEHHVFVQKPKTGYIENILTASSLMQLFCFFSFLILPISTLLNSNIRKISYSIRLPIAPFYVGIIFLTENTLNKRIENHYQQENLTAIKELLYPIVDETQKLTWAAGEIHETLISFLFMLTAFWFIMQTHKSKLPQSL